MQSHTQGHLVYAASGVLAVHTERGTSVVPANRVAWTPAGFTHYHRAHGDTDMRIVFLAPSLARLIPDHPAVFLASDLAREVLLALTGPRNYDDTAPAYSPPRALVSTVFSSMSSARHTNSHCTFRSHATTDCKPLPGCCTRTRQTTPRWPTSGRRSEPAPAPSADCSATSSA